MKKLFLFVVAAVLLAGYGSLAMAADGEWTGWIADANCAKDYSKSASAGHAGCAKGCVRKGAKWALSLPNTSYLLEIDAAEADRHVGHEVTVKGDLDTNTNTIKVTSVSSD